MTLRSSGLDPGTGPEPEGSSVQAEPPSLSHGLPREPWEVGTEAADMTHTDPLASVRGWLAHYFQQPSPFSGGWHLLFLPLLLATPQPDPSLLHRASQPEGTSVHSCHLAPGGTALPEYMA